jgi:hypothetical protein
MHDYGPEWVESPQEVFENVPNRGSMMTATAESSPDWRSFYPHTSISEPIIVSSLITRRRNEQALHERALVIFLMVLMDDYK